MQKLLQSKYFQTIALIPLILTVSSCASIVSKNQNLAPPNHLNTIKYPNIDQQLGEKLYPNEQMIAKEISDIIENSIRKQYSSTTALRDAHPKAHGCVQAEFHVLENLPSRFAQGIFIPGKTYKAWIRFSNGSRDATQPDIKKDARGMAIKILNVSGKKILEGEEQATTQDFIMINHPVFFANDPNRYMSLMQDVNSESSLKKLHIPFALGLKGTKIALDLNTRISNPLQARYWSMVPYQLGIGADRQAVKYSARACSKALDAIPNKPNDNYLRDALRTNLEKEDACMEFLIQPRTSDKLAVEDSMTEWQEKQAPFYKVATIRIPKQVFDTAEQNKFCENLSFTPWHALPEHRPLGVTNRLRKVIYERISKVRHEMNATQMVEP